ncbi:PucR family transcriptional regulator [Niallia sp. 01092]|uniref:PucR family transcriptional regulator n=1 Tax=unclassified Niallia TaxID=2837522 RepID=UPI003FD46354
MKELELTVSDVLKRKTFDKAKLLAGKNGLKRKIKWSHILEVKDMERFVNGGELILTTGINLQLDAQIQLEYVSKLIDLDTACLCIEMGSCITSIPKNVLELADERNYPIIIFEETVKFVEITQDLHTVIINQHHQRITDLDRLSNHFNKLSLQPNGMLKILQELHHYFQHPAFFLCHDSESYYYPSNQKQTECIIHSYLQEENFNIGDKRFVSLQHHSFVTVPVRVFEQIWGYIFLEINEFFYNDFYLLVLDRAAIAISQILLRYRTMEERKQNVEEEFIRTLLSDKSINNNQIRSLFPIHYPQTGYRIICWAIDSIADLNRSLWNESKVQISMMLRSLFQQKGFHPIISVRPHEIIAIVFTPPIFTTETEQNKWEQLANTFLFIDSAYFPAHPYFGISSISRDISSVKKGYEEALSVLSLKKNNLIKNHFFEEIGIYRLLLPLQKSGELKNYIDNYLGKLLAYDAKNDSQLLKTLAVYLECSGSKKESADRLFIVRQTLYHRIEKIESLLGKDFMNPANRLAIETAIQAYYLENGSEQRLLEKADF